MHYDLGDFDDETSRLEPIDKCPWRDSITHAPGMERHTYPPGIDRFTR
jgi:hypothetical protein